MTTEINTLLTNDPPAGAEGNIYAATYISGVDTDWNISITNLVDVDPPYEEWTMEDNSRWAWSVDCTGEEPTWSCDYFDPPPAGGSTSLRFPWQTGTTARYGIFGVHAGANMISGSLAVDLVGGDSMGSNVMPPVVYAASSGYISSICSDGTSMAIRMDGGPVPLAYFHLDLGQSFTVGQAFSQGAPIGSLRYGSFNLAVCGWANQEADQYHLHFVFMPTSPGYLEIGGCVLDLDTKAFVCDGSTYHVLNWLPNGGGSSPIGTPVPGATPDPRDPYAPVQGGAHIWDGIVNAIVSLSADRVSQYLPAQDPMVTYTMEKVGLVTQFSVGTSMLIYSYGLTGSVVPIIILVVIGMELTFLVMEVVIVIVKFVGPFLRFL